MMDDGLSKPHYYLSPSVQMLRTVRSVFVQYAQQPSTLVLQSIVFSRLLIILSDGRGVFSDGGVVSRPLVLHLLMNYS